MPRTIRTFFDPNFQDSDNFIELDASESFHLVKVLRLEIGNKVEAMVACFPCRWITSPFLFQYIHKNSQVWHLLVRFR